MINLRAIKTSPITQQNLSLRLALNLNTSNRSMSPFNISEIQILPEIDDPIKSQTNGHVKRAIADKSNIQKSAKYDN
ncbi:unnamed protein product [Rhizophagus irregularis]|nr:unnamed protein product [Rhizophagus irregularis]